MDLIEFLRGVSKEIRQKRRYATDEAKTRSFLVEPFLKRLGYDPGNPDDVTPEFIAGFVAKKTKVDYALKKDGKPIIFVEVKSAITSLSHNHTVQLQHYFSTKLDVRFGIVTNGLEYRFYADLDLPNVMDDAPFLIVDMLNFDEAYVADLSIFTKSSFDVDRAKSHAIGLKHKFALRRVLEQEIDSPSDELIKLFIKRIRPELKGVTKKVSAEMTPIVKEVWAEFTFGGQDGGPPAPHPPSPRADVVEIPVFASHNRHRFEATLLVDEIMNWHKKAVIVRFDGELMSCVAAAKQAVRSLNPARKTGKSGLSFWQFSHPVSGEDLSIKEICEDVQKGGPLRQQLLDNVNS